MAFDLIRLRKRLDPQSLVAAERHPVTGRPMSHGRRDKARQQPHATLAATRSGASGFGSGAVGLLAAGALVTAAAGGAAAAVKSSSSGEHGEHPAVIGPPSPSPLTTPARTVPSAVSLPKPCDLVTQAAAEQALGAKLDPSENKPASCLYAGKDPSPFRTLEIRYDPPAGVEHIRQTLTAAQVKATPIPALGPGAFVHPPYLQKVNGTTQFLPAEAVVPVGPVAVIFSTITLEEGSSAGLVNPARDASVAAAIAQAVLPAYVQRQ
ncbi:MAG: hypothetical protein QOC82_1145 [Frankiaceae bacterium]|nr:hypothetical protein [Frankiaceae bacterium]